MAPPLVCLTWHRFSSMTGARAAFSRTPCVYAQADAKSRVVRIGKASMGLTARYRGGTCWALDAAMHSSQNFVFVAAVAAESCSAVETLLIWRHRAQLAYNNLGKAREPGAAIEVAHKGELPVFEAEANPSPRVARRASGAERRRIRSRALRRRRRDPAGRSCSRRPRYSFTSPAECRARGQARRARAGRAH